MDISMCGYQTWAVLDINVHCFYLIVNTLFAVSSLADKGLYM